jgi:hypothetical protein
VNEVLLARRIADHKYSLSNAFDRVFCCPAVERFRFKVCVTFLFATVRLLQLSDYDSSYAQQRVDVNAYNTKQQGVQARLQQQQQQQQYNYTSAGNTKMVVMAFRDLLCAGVM